VAYFLSFPYISVVTLRHTLARGALVALICFEYDCQLDFQITVLIHSGLACSSSAADYDSDKLSMLDTACYGQTVTTDLQRASVQDLQRASVPPSPRPSTVQPNFDAPPAPGDRNFAGGPGATSADDLV